MSSRKPQKRNQKKQTGEKSQAQLDNTSAGPSLAPQPVSEKEGTPWITWAAIAFHASLASFAIYRFWSAYSVLKQQQPEYGNSSVYRVEEIAGKGKGVIASRDIQQGELVIRERPLFIVPETISVEPTRLITERLEALSPYDQARFMDLSYMSAGADSSYEDVALSIFQTNSVSAGQNSVGIFPRMARLNHGCSSAFNVVYSWRPRDHVLVVHALKNITAGEELLTAYTDTKKPRHERRQYLEPQYGFTCQCAVCSLPEASSRQSDDRLTEMSRTYHTFGTWGSRGINGVKAVEYARMLWKLGEDEGYWSERGRLAADAAWVAAAHSDENATKAWALLARQWYAIELGEDSEQVEEMSRVSVDPRGHKSWGTREPMVVGSL